MKGRLLALLLIFCILIPFAAACGGGNGGGGNGGASENEGRVHSGPPVEIVIYSQLANYSGDLVGWSAEVLLEKFNVKVKIVNDAVRGTFQTRMESGDLGDIVLFGSDGKQYRDASRAGLLFDWEEDDLMWEYGEFITEYFMAALNKNKGITGTLHGFGHEIAGSSNDHAQFYYYPQIRFDLYQKLGYPEINTLEDFIPVLAAMVEMEPVSSVGTKTYAVSSFPDWDGDMVMMVKSTAALYGWEEFGIGLYDTKTQTWEDCLKEDGWYLRALKFYNTLFQMGLYDPDSMTQDWNILAEKYKNGVAMFNIFEWIATPFNSEEHKQQGKIMMPVVAADQVNLADGLSVYGKNRIWSIGANTVYPELCMEIINWFSTPEGVLTYYYGPKGVTWDYDDDGEAYLTALGLQCQEDKENTIVQYRDYEGTYKNGEFQHNNLTWAQDAVNPESPSGHTFNYKTWPSTILAQTVYPIEQEWRDWTGYARADDWFTAIGKKSVAIASTYTADTRPMELEMTWEQVTTCIKDGSWRAIYASSDAEFDAIVAQMRSDAVAYGYGECVEWCLNEAQRRKDAEDAISG